MSIQVLESPKIAEIRRRYSERKTKLILDTLDEREFNQYRVEDMLALAKVKRMPRDVLLRYGSYEPKEEYRKEYIDIQVFWIHEEISFLSSELGRKPTAAEISQDSKRWNNGERFRAFYVMKFRDRVQRVDVQRPEEAVL